MYGIDRTKMTIPIRCINMDKFKSSGGLVTGYFGVGDYIEVVDSITGEYHRVKGLQVKGERGIFNDLRCSVSFTKSKGGAYAVLDLTASRLENSYRNLVPMKVEDYMQNLKELLVYLEKKYGIYLDIKDCSNTYVELNVTFLLESFNFDDYHHILNLICLCRNKVKYQNDPVLTHGKYNNSITQIKIQNSNEILKIYNKTYELFKNYQIHLDDEYMRIEISLRNFRAFVRTFQKNSLLELSDEEIKNYINKKIKEELFDTVKSYSKASYEMMKGFYKEAKDKSLRGNAISSFVEMCNREDENKIPYLFDYLQLEQIIKEADKVNGARTIKRELNKELSPLLIRKNDKKFKNNCEKFNHLKSILNIE